MYYQQPMSMSMPTPAGMTMNMAPQGGMSMNMPLQGGMNQTQVDPVTKAVADNIMGKYPGKKPMVRCYECGLDFTSQVVLDAHLQGARHAKQIRSKTIMATLKQTNMSFSKDELTNGLKCNPCNVLLNSIQQLQTHLNGNRHKKKLAQGNKNKMAKNTQPTNNKCRRTMYLNTLIEKNAVVLIYCLILFTFACLVLLLTFIFHLYIL